MRVPAGKEPCWAATAGCAARLLPPRSLPLPPPPWPNTQVSKKLLLFYVRNESGGGERSTPNCLARVAVHERLVRRWVPESHRPPPGGAQQQQQQQQQQGGGGWGKRGAS